MTISLGAALLAGCVELPGVYYNVFFDDRPSETDCLNLTDALTAELSLELQPSIYPCAVTLDNDGQTPPRNVIIFAYFRQRRILIEIDELRSGKATAPSQETQQFAQRVMQIVHGRFPAARLVSVKETVGPIAP